LRHCLGGAQQLQETLSKITAAIGDGKVAKLWKAMGGIAKEKSIRALLAALELEKSLLTLRIATIDS
jgi:hypothetical protein